MNLILTRTGKTFYKHWLQDDTLSPLILDKKWISIKTFVLCTLESCKTLEEGSKKLILHLKYLRILVSKRCHLNWVLEKLLSKQVCKGEKWVCKIKGLWWSSRGPVISLGIWRSQHGNIIGLSLKTEVEKEIYKK